MSINTNHLSLNKTIHGDSFDVQFLYKYLGDPNVRIHPLNELDWSILQEQIEKLKQVSNDIEEVDKLLSDISNNYPHSVGN